MDKLYRRSRILELLRAGAVATQADLCHKLGRLGLHVTQATVSRDIEDLGLVKTREGYRLPENNQPAVAAQPSLPLVLKEFLREARQASNMVVLKTNPGNAHSVAVALDSEKWPEVVGTVAGDDTIFIATSKASEASRVLRKIQSLLAA
jgi:transcriptional regulator of arginine metabolism